jgi:hypothetical protein
VEEAKTSTTDTAKQVVAIKAGAEKALRDEEKRVGAESDEEKVKDGNDLFK